MKSESLNDDIATQTRVDYYHQFNRLFQYRIQKELVSWCIYSFSLNDTAHNVDHVYRVCQTGLTLFEYYQDVYDLTERDKELIMVACLLHDIGCRYNRQHHHLIGYGLVFEHLSRYCPEAYSENEMLLIAKCVLEHRSSNRKTPKGIHSQIVNVADSGCPDITLYIRRALQFRLDTPHEQDQIIKEVCDHLHEKFDQEKGYHWKSYPTIGTDFYSEEWKQFDQHLKDAKKLTATVHAVYAELTTLI